ncbi:NAD/NADP transhydrogenase alpha subunit [Fodinisporobacter ferrooxydans]|uniref:NAD/NADP transhydrogenase alpha subunit n=1 Tax=Fodinisporobacter ferrooxydans TaxID=2901836 RepID=A0ABY4CMC6_9BACL|nr:NAD/NADP transhydrogenase alpha subunit [Alicyclobacillaceae bacterium MYW30-H2]
MKCITVYTNSYETFSDIYEEILNSTFSENEEKEIEGIIVSESGDVPADYIEQMRNKPEVAVMKIKKRDITIMQHGQVFEILMPSEEPAVQ